MKIMKMKHLVSVLAAVASIAIMGCTFDLAPTEPADKENFYARYDVNGDSANSGIWLNINGNGGGPLNLRTGIGDTSTGVGADNEGSVTFYNPADFLNDKGASTNAELTAKLKEFLHFYNIATFTGSRPDNTANSLGAEISYTVIARYDNTLVLQFTFTGANWGAVVAKVEGAKYTYRNGHTIDVDGNGVGGEAFYDDYYDYNSVTIGNSSGSIPSVAGNVQYDWQAAPINAGTQSRIFLSNAANLQQLTAWTGTGANSSATVLVRVAELDPSWPTPAHTYAADIGSRVILQKYDYTSNQFVDQPALTFTWSTVNSYYETPAITVTDNELYRFKYSSKVIETAAVNGGKIRKYFVNYTNRKFEYEYSDVILANSSTRIGDGTISGNDWIASANGTSNDNHNLAIDVNLWSGSSDVIGNQGLKAITGTLKVGYNPDNTVVVGYPEWWAGLVLYDVTPTLRWSNYTNTNDENSNLNYWSGASQVYVQDRLHLAFDTALAKDTIGNNDDNGWYLFLSPDYGYNGDYAAGVDNSGKFGDYKNYSNRIDGKPWYHYYRLPSEVNF
ncbi:hypothetical protein FACS1894141_3210 [Spirochaetia bacterium]|nr:hypothetical protein FACS1894141_3210 [Spirochaetia bacterium]